MSILLWKNSVRPDENQFRRQFLLRKTEFRILNLTDQQFRGAVAELRHRRLDRQKLMRKKGDQRRMVESREPDPVQRNPSSAHDPDELSRADVVEAAERIRPFLRIPEKFEKAIPLLLRILPGADQLFPQLQAALPQSFQKSVPAFDRGKRIDLLAAVQRKMPAPFPIEAQNRNRTGIPQRTRCEYALSDCIPGSA